jgi:transposase-like protein
VHLTRNVLAHVPQARKSEIAAAIRGCFEQADTATAKAQVELLVKRYSKSCAKAMEILMAGIDDALNFMAFPVEHQRRLWSTNPIETETQSYIG